MYEVHGWLMSLAWGVLAPAAIVLAYNFRNVGPTSMWFHAHRILMVSSLTEPYWSFARKSIDLSNHSAGTPRVKRMSGRG
jgi:hypothetical protein